MTSLKLSALVLLALAGSQVSALELTFIANEGFLIADGPHKILIDALFVPTEPREEFVYGFPSEELLEAMIAGEGEFERIDLLLITHHDADHFDARTVARFLDAHEETRLVATDEVLERLSAVDVEPSRMERLELDWGAQAAMNEKGMRITVYRTHHSAGRSLQNQMYLIAIGDQKVLHEGDAAREERTFQGLGLEREEIDIALLHDWYVLTEDGRKVLENLIRPREVRLMHVPPVAVPSLEEELEREVERLGERLPPVFVSK